MRHRIATVIRCAGIMIAAIHILHVFMLHGAVMHIAVLVVTRSLVITHITGRSLQRLRCKQYKYGQQDKFHRIIIHFQSMWCYGQLFFGKFQACWRLRSGTGERGASALSVTVAAAPKPENQTADCEEAHSQGQQVIYNNSNRSKYAAAMKIQQ